MTDDYNQWEADCKKIRKDNKILLNKFQMWLNENGLKEKTIRNHVGNVDFYINDFLLYSDSFEAKDGYNVNLINEFLGDWFIRKTSWASVAEIKSNAASFKKFYTFLLERGDIKKDNLDELKQEIKEEMPYWIKNMKRVGNW